MTAVERKRRGRQGANGERAELSVTLVAVDELHPSQENPRRIAPKRLDQLKRSLNADPLMLRARPVVALTDGTIVAGNMRWLAARELGWTEIPCVRVDLTAEQARVWMLRDNQSYGEWVDEPLATLLADLDDVTRDLAGFDQRELDRLLDDTEPTVEPQLAAMTYSLLVDCASEQDQRALAERLEGDGFTVKLLMA